MLHGEERLAVQVVDLLFEVRLFLGEHLAFAVVREFQHLVQAGRVALQAAVDVGDAPEAAGLLVDLAGPFGVAPQVRVGQVAVEFVQPARFAGNVKGTPGVRPVFLAVPAWHSPFRAPYLWAAG
ncbi:hypothetical protein GCM10008939_14950 [Deinococcus aquiradiocola]|uniref:Uncharacterized protein n=1 Tax=Deinococcus aquiradiocola TaxID=393059 RepID=A0A917UPA2_9DEIO|nr:hypothetical protein GCM10008939_14950 [Deinococcus aquiradiocola]